MKASKFSDAQKAFNLKQGDDGVPVAEICRKAEISHAAYFNWPCPKIRVRLKVCGADKFEFPENQ
jgi:Transposase